MCGTKLLVKREQMKLVAALRSSLKQRLMKATQSSIFFSDNCVPQNKNSMLFSMYNVLSCKYGIKIVHTYLEKGHTQMECDSIHAFIERRCSKQTLCTPSAFFGVIRTAKVKPPFYELVKMTQTDIFDFKEVA